MFPFLLKTETITVSEQTSSYIPISKNQTHRILHLKHHAYYYYLTLTQQLTHFIIDQLS